MVHGKLPSMPAFYSPDELSCCPPYCNLMELFYFIRKQGCGFGQELGHCPVD